MGKERATLPFERSEGYSQHESKPSTNVTQGASNKKRIEVFVSPELAHEVVAATRELEQEATLYDSKGLGKERQKVRGGRGMVESDSAYSTRRTIVTIVDSNQATRVIHKIKSVASGRGQVLTSSPEEELIHL
ncbi:MAG: hypothetical protein M3530_05355 [Thermoproteota archaeon]|nr:hypothetical protein [Thermoproteota archaeon]